MREGLARLQAAEFLYEASLFPDLEYTFKHALTHDVAYASLLQERRRELHGRIVQAIETLYADRLDEHTERLAHHALQAELWDQALQLSAAGCAPRPRRGVRFERPHAISSLRSKSSRGCLTVVGIAEEEIDIRLQLRNALLPAADFRRMADILARAITLAERVGDRRRLAQAHGYQTLVLIERSHAPQAVQSGRLALALVRGDRGFDTDP